MKDLIKSITKQDEQVKKEVNESYILTDEICDKIQISTNGLPCKQFEPRNSLLTDLYKVKHVRTVYNISLATLLGLFLHTLVYDYLQKGESKFGFNLLLKGFTNFHLLILIWLGMFLGSLPVYFGFRFWVYVRIQLKPKSLTLTLWNSLCLGTLILYYPLFLSCSTLAVIKNEQQMAASIGLLIEMTRFLMKSHAFVRSNAPRVLHYTPHGDEELLCPDFRTFLYFSFAPTMIYQDSYPRTTVIQWKFVFIWFLEFLGAIFFLGFILERFFIPPLENFGIKPYTWKDVLLIIMENYISGQLILLSIFYMILHAWHNAFAEMLGFSDRLFYKDWWTSSTYDRYYRTWNVVVHDWLYTYVYKDFYEIVLPKNKVAARLMVFFLSAVFHDYILGFSFKFCLPILFIQFFGFGVILTFLKVKQDVLGNILLWYSGGIGMSINCAFYGIEYYSRVHCPIENVTFASYFIPQFISCNNGVSV